MALTRPFSRFLCSMLLLVNFAGASFAQQSETAVDLGVVSSAATALSPADQASKHFAMAKKFTTLGQKSAAIEHALEATKLCPNWNKPFVLIALNLMDIGKWDEAIKYGQAALKLNRNDEEANAALTAIYFRAFKPFEAIASGQDYLKRFPRGLYREQVQAQIEESDRNKKHFLDRMKWEAGSNYLAQTSDKEKARWQASSMPLRVYVEPGSSEMNEQLRSAFWQWQQNSKGYVSFVFVNDERQADIDCSWQTKSVEGERVIERGSNSIVLDSSAKNKGMTGGSKLTLGSGCIIHATMELMSASPEVAPAESMNRFQISAMHQIGHCLGLIGHSNAKPDLMHEINSMDKKNIEREAKLNDRDVNTLLALYQQTPANFIAETNYSRNVSITSNKRNTGSSSYSFADAQVSQGLAAVAH